MSNIESLLSYLDIPSDFNNKRFKHNIFKELQDHLEVYDKDQKFLLDKEDQWVLNFRYCGVFKDKSDIRYVQLKVKGKRVFLHNALLQPKEGNVIDHINGNTLDYRRCNLREVTRQSNCLNKKTYKNSKHRGVSKTPNKFRPYVARIQVNKKSVYLGAFETLEEALQVRNQAEVKYFGEMRREG